MTGENIGKIANRARPESSIALQSHILLRTPGDDAKTSGNAGDSALLKSSIPYSSRAGRRSAVQARRKIKGQRASRTFKRPVFLGPSADVAAQRQKNRGVDGFENFDFCLQTPLQSPFNPCPHISPYPYRAFAAYGARRRPIFLGRVALRTTGAQSRVRASWREGSGNLAQRKREATWAESP
jgi:hypothetical protein